MGSVLSSAFNFTDLVVEVEFNIMLIKDIISKSDKSSILSKNLRELETALSSFAYELYKPIVMLPFCGKATSKDPFFTKLLNKYQRDTIDPFARRICYASLDETKFKTPFTKLCLSVSMIKYDPVLLAEFEILLQKDEIIFKNPREGMTNPGYIRCSHRIWENKSLLQRLKDMSRTTESI